ncbi:MAG: hypothetical protein ACXVB9_08155 [Bdellovibrionota bacterium]
MNFSAGALIAGCIFGSYGIVVLKTGMRDANMSAMGFGAALLLYSYFIPNPWLCWGIGIALSVFAFRALKSG